MTTPTDLTPFTFDDLHIIDHEITCTDTPRGTTSVCTCGWSSTWGVRDGSAEADAAGHLTRSLKSARQAVSPEYAAIGAAIDELRDDANKYLWFTIKPFTRDLTPSAWSINQVVRRWADQFRSDHFPQPNIDEDDEEFGYCDDPIHEDCYCAATDYLPCSACEPCSECLGQS